MCVLVPDAWEEMVCGSEMVLALAENTPDRLDDELDEMAVAMLSRGEDQSKLYTEGAEREDVA